MANPVVTFEMKNGEIMKAELYPEIAANTVRNFISLVDFSPCDQRLYDSGRMSGRSGNGRPGLQHPGRVFTERF